jgi:hypothetical protein
VLSCVVYASFLSDKHLVPLSLQGLQGDHTHGQRKAVNAVYELIGTADDMQIPGAMQGERTGF